MDEKVVIRTPEWRQMKFGKLQDALLQVQVGWIFSLQLSPAAQKNVITSTLLLSLLLLDGGHQRDARRH
jgi:hypothetical protein